MGRIFLSTLSLRRATLRHCTTYLNCSHFYPRSPCGERQYWATRARAAQLFLSTLSLRRATVLRAVSNSLVIFLSTLSLRRATDGHASHVPFYPISIHALLAESDGLDVTIIGRTWDISIHALLAESDGAPVDRMPSSSISIHALLAESDPHDSVALVPHQHFYPRSPCGERRYIDLTEFNKAVISIHALLAESDSICQALIPPRNAFLSTLSLRRATIDCHCLHTSYSNFYPRSPCGERRRYSAGGWP